MIRMGKSIRHKLVKLLVCSFTKLNALIVTEESSIYVTRHEISNNVVVAISKVSD